MRLHLVGLLTLGLACIGAGCGKPATMNGPGPDLAEAPPTTATFTQAVSMPMSTSRWGMPIASLASDRRFIGFGGDVDAGVANDTWSYSSMDQSWTHLVDTMTPDGRYCYCSVYLPNQNEILLVGGRDLGGALPAAAFTFEVATRNWTRVNGDAPRGVIGCSAAYFPKLGKAFVFGGGSDTGLEHDTWSYDPSARAFTLLSPDAHPPGRQDAATAFDPGDGTTPPRMLVFGGVQQISPIPRELDDLWAFDGSTWSQLQPAGDHPKGRRATANAFDELHRRWIVFGGTVEVDDLNDLWTFDAKTSTWQSWSPMGDVPSARGFASAGFDAIEGTVLIFGGYTQTLDLALADGFTLKLK
jgi:N-acetylneuraminic acid mutarotase